MLGTALGYKFVGGVLGTLIVEDDLRASLDEHSYAGCADSARATGDDGYFVLNGKCDWHIGGIIEPCGPSQSEPFKPAESAELRRA
jgi:hypothetical protein